MEHSNKNSAEVIFDFGDEWGCITKQDIQALFVGIHASVSPLDPLGVKAAPDDPEQP